MSFPTTSVLDAFTRANANPLSGASWDTTNHLPPSPTRFLQLVSNQVTDQASGGNDCDSGWTLTYGGEVEIYATWVTVTSRLRLWAKLSAISTTVNGYVTEWQNAAGSIATVFRFDAGVGTQLGATVAVTPAANDVMGMDLQNDTSGTITVYQNGTARGTRTDTTYKAQTGALGMGCRGDGDVMDNFGGGVTVSNTQIPFRPPQQQAVYRM